MLIAFDRTMQRRSGLTRVLTTQVEVMETDTLECSTRRIADTIDVYGVSYKTGILTLQMLESLLGGRFTLRKRSFYYNGRLLFHIKDGNGVLKVLQGWSCIMNFHLAEGNSLNGCYIHYGEKIGDLYRIAISMVVKREIDIEFGHINLYIILDRDDFVGIEGVAWSGDIVYDDEHEIYMPVDKSLKAKLKLCRRSSRDFSY